MSMRTIDRKFIIAAQNPVNGNTYTQENSFLFCAHDRAVPFALEAYKRECKNLKCSEEHIQSIELLIMRVKNFQIGDDRRLPTTEGDAELARCLEGKGV